MKNPFALLGLSLLLCSSHLPAEAAIRGLLIYQTPGAAKPISIPFSSITWQSAAVGSVQVVEGGVVGFTNASIVKLVYLDEPYWNVLRSDDTLSIYRADVLAAEVSLPLNRLNMVTPADLQAVELGRTQLVDLIKEFPDLRHRNILEAALANLERQLGWYGEGRRKVAAKWYSAEEYAALQNEEGGGSSEVLETTDGKRYENYKVTSVDAASIHIALPGGLATVPLANLSRTLQEKYNYDPAKAAEFLKAKQEQAAAASQGPVVPVALPVGGMAKEEDFLAKQPPEVVPQYQKVFDTLETQRVLLKVTQSRVSPTGVLAMQYSVVQPGKPLVTSAQPVFIVGHFSPELDNGSFQITAFPAGTCTGDEYADTSIPRLVPCKVDYLQVMKIHYDKQPDPPADKNVSK